ncbi:TPA: DUF433 domain-containing protein [Candidatus Poribacteria bacterium]|nr:DUF433 domain-containing protein [Candidatus Poribacteria bacterium]
MQRIEFGKYIVADPNICHGALTFKGTRIFVLREKRWWKKRN